MSALYILDAKGNRVRVIDDARVTSTGPGTFSVDWSRSDDDVVLTAGYVPVTAQVSIDMDLHRAVRQDLFDLLMGGGRAPRPTGILHGLESDEERRRRLVGALDRRAIASIEAGVSRLFDEAGGLVPRFWQVAPSGDEILAGIKEFQRVERQRELRATDPDYDVRPPREWRSSTVELEQRRAAVVRSQEQTEGWRGPTRQPGVAGSSYLPPARPLSGPDPAAILDEEDPWA